MVEAKGASEVRVRLQAAMMEAEGASEVRL